MRTPIKQGTIIKLPSGSSYQIIGAPIGSGGGSLLYPAARVIRNEEGTWEQGAIRFAIKECFPFSSSYSFVRSDSGEIISEGNHEEANRYLARAREMQIQEEKITGAVYEKGFRLIPTLESAEGIELSGDGSEFHKIRSTVTIMESLDQKGQSLHALMKESRRLNAHQTLKIIEQILLAVREVHEAGYLHLDIQDGNIFMRGTLEDESSLVSLIDFSAARKLEDDGKTAEIEDRVIYSTQGFTPPEILNKNDGSLRLGKEADIYEIGCLLVLLLTGHPINYERTYLSDGAKSIKPYEMKRTDCPAHLQERLNGLITTALRNEPDDRYHDCDGMLAVVRDLLDAMQTHKSAISQMDYDAFVCYRHSENDSAAAVALQRALERYKAPRSIGKKRTIGRVFVDEGELSSCADFGEQIREALKNAQWLVVVCSPQTRESPWVNLEIDTFLEYHDRSRILAVLTEGEPEESFPEELLKKTEGEVFAADARGTTVSHIKKKIKGDALLRIAAPMLGTTFDSLKQRQKTYRVQRVAAAATAAFALLSGFTGYAVHQNRVLDAQYQETLMNESRRLVREAEQHIDNQDRLSAISKLIEALPTTDNPRPYVPEAQGLLTEALNAYVTPAEVKLTATSVDVFESKSKLDYKMYFDEDGDYIFTKSREGKEFYIISSETMESVKVMEFDGKVEFFYDELINSEKKRVYLSESFSDGTSKVSCVSYPSGKTDWSLQEDKIRAMSLCHDESQLAVLTDEKMLIISSDDGKTIKSIPLDMDETLPEGMKRVKNKSILKVSERGEKAVWSVQYERENSDLSINSIYDPDRNYRDYIAILDLKTGDLQIKETDCFLISYIDLYENDCAYVVGNSDFTEKIHINGQIYNGYQENQAIIYKMDISSAQTIWKHQYTHTGPSKVAYAVEKDQDGSSYLLLAAGSHCEMIKDADGNGCYTYDLPSEIARITAPKGEEKGEGFGVYLRNGSFGSIKTATGEYSEVEKLVIDDVVYTENRHPFLYVSHRGGESAIISDSDNSVFSDKIIKYEWERYDNNWKKILSLNDENGVRWVTNNDDQMDILTMEDSVLIFYGTNEDDVIETKLPKSEYKWEPLAMTKDGEMILYTWTYEKNESGTVLATFAFVDSKGKIHRKQFVDPDDKHGHIIDVKAFGDYVFVAEDIYPNCLKVYRCNLGDLAIEQAWEISDIANSNVALFPIDNNRFVLSSIDITSKKREILYFAEGKEILIRSDPYYKADGTQVEHPMDIQCNIRDEIIVMLDDGDVSLYDYSGKLIDNIDQNYKYKAMYQTEHRLYLYDEEGNVSLYSIPQCKCVHRETVCEFEGSYWDMKMVDWAPNEMAILFSNSVGDGHFSPRGICVFYCSDEEFKQLALIQHFHAYCKNSKTIYNSISNGDTNEESKGTAIGSMPYYSLDDLIAMGRERTPSIHRDT